jgi:predicted phosphodiesterase
MQRISFEIPLDCEIVAMGDTHLGSAMCHVSGIRKVIEYIHNGSNRYWLHMGDWIEAIATDDKRYEHDTTQQPIPLKQAKEAVKVFSSISKRCIVGLTGNHENKLHRYGDLAEYICENLKIPFGTYSARVKFTHSGNILFRAFVWHGPTRGAINSSAKDWEQRQANMRASLKMKLKYKYGDCAVMLMGHVHKLITVEPTSQLYLHDGGASGTKQGYLTGRQSGSFIDPDLRWYGCTGAFLKLYEDGVSGYAEIAGYDPVELGYLLIKIKGGKIENIERKVI